MKFPRELVVLDRDLKRIPANKQFLIVAGAQGQQESALMRIARDTHKFVTIGEQDTVIISADPIPGRENDVNGMIDDIYRHGSRVSYSDIMEDLHVSGHGSSGDMMLLLSAVGPQYVIPIGGTYKHMMQYKRLAEDIGYNTKDILIPKSGQILEFRKDERPRVVDTVELAEVMIDGLGVGDVGSVVLKDRLVIAHEGIVVVVIPVDKPSGVLAGKPQLVTRGFVYVKQSGELLSKATQIIADAVRRSNKKHIEWQQLRKRVEESLGTFLLKETGRSPLIVSVIQEI